MKICFKEFLHSVCMLCIKGLGGKKIRIGTSFVVSRQQVVHYGFF